MLLSENVMLKCNNEESEFLNFKIFEYPQLYFNEKFCLNPTLKNKLAEESLFESYQCLNFFMF